MNPHVSLEYNLHASTQTSKQTSTSNTTAFVIIPWLMDFKHHLEQKNGTRSDDEDDAGEEDDEFDEDGGGFRRELEDEEGAAESLKMSQVRHVS